MFLQASFAVCFLVSALFVRSILLHWNNNRMPWSTRTLLVFMIVSWFAHVVSLCVFTFASSDAAIVSFDANGKLQAYAKYTFVRCIDDRCMRVPKEPVIYTNQLVASNGKKAIVYSSISITNPQLLYRNMIQIEQKNHRDMFDADDLNKHLSNVGMNNWAFEAMIARNQKDPLLAAKLTTFENASSVSDQLIRDLKIVVQKEMNSDLAYYGLTATVQEILIEGGR